MKIDPEDKHTSLPRRWALPLGVAAGVAALSVAAVAVFGGQGADKPALAANGANPGNAATSPVPTPTAARAGSATPSARATSDPTAAFSVTSTGTTPISAGAVARILASCLGSDAPDYHAVIAVRTPVASHDWDGAVIAVDSGHRYVQCETKGDRGTSQDVPPTFVNDRLWGTGRLIEFFDSVGEPAGRGRYLSLGAGHYAPEVAKITVSYGDDPKQYPAVMAGGAFFSTAAFSTGASTREPFSAYSTPYVHAYDAAGREIYDQQKDPRFTGDSK
ncbi:hypothetical protein V2S66_00225 [Streptomyces sp. V4-01]|uniref:Uncharacterized protein n=1 Tax=Actinacidiphila polyblastidii TaxID=3110430 RepID=A0ABU7P3K6_9ACTN|nr:hypothetical protein [Streptomyces sp. V4-01]